MVQPIAYISTEAVPGPLEDAISREVEQVAPSNYTAGSTDGPILTTFATLQEEPSINHQLELAGENGVFTLVSPPIHKEDRTTTITTIEETELTIRHNEAEKIHLGKEVFPDTPDCELSVSTIGYFESYSGREFGKDGNDEPVLVELRETSTTGGILFTTIALNKLAVSGNEQHRRDLIAALIAYLDEAIEDTEQVEKSGSIDDPSPEKTETKRSVPAKQYDAGLLTLYYYIHSDEVVELTSELPEDVLPTGLAAEFTEEEWEQFIEIAEQDGLIDESGVRLGAVSEAVDERSLRSFARRLEL